MKQRNKIFFRKALSIIASVMLILQSATPYIIGAQAFSANAVHAQELTPTPTVQPTPTQVEVTPTGTVTPTPTVTTLVTPTITPTVAPSEIDDSSDSNSEENNSDENSEPEETSEPENTPTPSPEPTTDVDGDLVTNVIESAQCFENSINGCNAQVTTDKEDYAPTEHVFVTGTNFEPHTEYTLVIFSNDEPATRFETTITTNEVGAFSISYELDGIYRPDYQIDVFDVAGALVATVTFTDGNPAATLEQCRNGAAGSPNDCTVLGGGVGWVSGNAGSSNSHYVEGFSVPYRTIMTDLPISPAQSVELILGYDVKHSGGHAIDYLTHFDRLQPHTPFGHASELIDPTSGVTGFSATTSTFTIPAPGTLGTPVPGQPTASFNALPAGDKLMTLYGGTITAISYVTEGDLSTSNAETQIKITFTPDSETAVLSWGGHIGSRLDWGFDAGIPRSAGGISGAPYHMRLIDWNLSNLGNQDRSLSADAVIPPGNLTIVKDVVPDDASTWDFNVSGTDVNQNVLGLGDGDSEAVSVPPGTYAITETTDPLYETTVECTDDATQGVVATGDDAVNVTVESNQSVTCTYTNTRNTGSITVIKDVVPDDATLWDVSIAGILPSDHTLGDGDSTGSQVVPTGDYVITEVGDEGVDDTLYNSSYLCLDGAGAEVTSGLGREINLTVASQDDLTCTFTNTRKTGEITFEKIVVGGSADASDWQFAIAGVDGTFQDGDTVELPTGAYVVAESSDDDYDPTSVAGVCANLNGLSADLTVTENGGTCTFTNTIQEGDITVVKAIDWDESGVIGDHPNDTANAGAWTTWDIDGSGDYDTGTSQTVEVGSYTLSEDQLPNYHLVGWECSDGSSDFSDNAQNSIPVTVDEEGITCTFVNAPDTTSISGFKYEDEDGDLNTTDDQTGVQGWLITLYACLEDFTNCSINPFATTTTDETGAYSFTNLVSGFYHVVESYVAGWTNLTPVYEEVETTPGEDVEGVNFVNFQNGQISGYKWNDIDGDGVWDAEEPALEGWTINLTGDATDSDVTDADGYYEFTDLGPGSYNVDEVQQNGWTQTAPATGSYDIDMTSNGSFTDTNFGNQGRGTITVRKNLDTDGDTQVDETNVDGWTWDLSGTLGSSSENPMGDTSVEVAAGTYNVSEDQQAQYNVLGLVCENTSLGAVESGQVTVSPGEDVECTFTNTRKLGGITVYKNIDWDESGQIGDHPQDVEGATTWTWNIENGQQNIFTGSSAEVTTGNYTLTENQQANYHLVGWTCSDDSSGDTNSINVDVDEDGIECTFTNAPDKASITVIKNVNTDVDPEIEILGATDWLWNIDGSGDYATGSTQEVVPGDYTVSEEQKENYHVTGLVCNRNDLGAVESTEVSLDPGEDITCTFTNARDTGIVTFEKVVIGGDALPSDWQFTIGNVAGTYAHDDSVELITGQYDVTEASQNDDDYTPTDAYGICGNLDANNGIAVMTVTTDGGTCTFENTRDTGDIIVNKLIDTDADGEYESGNDTANVLGFAWGIGDEEATRTMGSSETVNTGTYDLTENKVEDYTFTGWFYTNGEGSCTDPDGVEEPEIEVSKDATTEVTFCNAHDTGTIVVDKVTDPSGSLEDFDFRLTQGDTLIQNFGLLDAEDPLEIGGLLTGLSYDLRETEVEGWDLTSVNCLRSDQASVDPTNITFSDGETVYCTFNNTQRAQVSVTKYHDRDADGVRDEDEEVLEGWTINLDEDSEVTDADGEVLFANVVNGEYILSEDLEEGWFQSIISCEDGEYTSTDNNLNVELAPGDELSCEIGNYTTGQVIVTKYQDNNGNGQIDEGEEVLEGWDMVLTEDVEEGTPDELGETTDENGEATFNNVPVGGHILSEVLQDGYQLTNIICDDQRLLERFQDEVVRVAEVFNGRSLTVRSDETVRCSVLNQPTNPVITIEKLNDSTSVETAGNQVVYTLRLTVSEEGGPSLNTIVTDLTPEGFEYVGGSFSATKNGAPFAVSEPTYASPGDWTLGDLEPGDVVEMFYTTDIASTQDSGLYPDLAWAIGQGVGGEEILADAGTDGNIGEENFVGTDVEIAVNESVRKSVNVEREVEEEGEVLGVSLPATGAETVWVLLAIILAALGFVSLGAGLVMLGGNKGKKSPLMKKITKMFGVFLLAAVVFGFSAGDAHAAIGGSSVRIETPADTSKDEFEVNFVYLDIQNRTASLRCLQKGPGDASYTQFDSTKNLQAGGDNGSCQVDSSVIDQDGTYLFKVEVTPSGDSAFESAVVSADVNTEAPKTPTNYSKKKLNSCKYELRFRTGDDAGLTSKIEVYRSDLTSFNADNGSRIHEQAAGSNEIIVFTDEVSDCNRDYYYAVRAFSSTGIGSGVIGDSVTVTVSSTGTTTTTTQESAEGESQLGAIPVGGASTTAGGADDEEASDEEADADADEEGETGDEEVLGATSDAGFFAQVQSFFSNPVALAVLVGLIVLAILGYVIQKRRS